MPYFYVYNWGAVKDGVYVYTRSTDKLLLFCELEGYRGITTTLEPVVTVAINLDEGDLPCAD